MSANTAEKLNNYPALAEMGITRFHEISHYKLSGKSSSEDVLRIKYERAKGSLLPDSRKYKFGRSIKTVIADGGTARMEQTYEISPFLLAAVAELDSLITAREKNAASAKSTSAKSCTKLNMISDVDQIERLLGESMTSADTLAAKARLANLRQQLQAL